MKVMGRPVTLADGKPVGGGNGLRDIALGHVDGIDQRQLPGKPRCNCRGQGASCAMQVQGGNPCRGKTLMAINRDEKIDTIGPAAMPAL